MSTDSTALVTGQAAHMAASADIPAILFGTTNPREVVERASETAAVLADVVEDRKLYTTIGKRRHLNIEAWTLLGAMLGVYANVTSSEPIHGGWQAHAVTRYRGHTDMTEADAMCTTDEENWRRAEPHAIRSMAQTRACSKALSLALRWVVELAGYSGTPAEEMGGAADEASNPRPRGRRAAPSRPPTLERLRNEVIDLAAERGLDRDDLTALAETYGVQTPPGAATEQLKRMREHLMRLPLKEKESTDDGEHHGESDQSTLPY